MVWLAVDLTPPTLFFSSFFDTSFRAFVLSVTSLTLVAGQVTDKVSLILDFMFVLLDVMNTAVMSLVFRDLYVHLHLHLCI